MQQRHSALPSFNFVGAANIGAGQDVHCAVFGRVAAAREPESHERLRGEIDQAGGRSLMLELRKDLIGDLNSRRSVVLPPNIRAIHPYLTTIAIRH